MFSLEHQVSGITQFIIVFLLCIVASCGLSDPSTIDISNCAFLSDNRHYLYEQRLTVTSGSNFLSGYSGQSELHYVDIISGRDSIISSRKDQDYFLRLLQHVNSSDSTFTMLNSDSVFVCMKDDLSRVIERPPHRYLIGNGTVAVDYHEHWFSTFDMIDTKTGLSINKPEGKLLVPHDCGILACTGYYDSIMVLELSGEVRAVQPVQKRYREIQDAVYAGNAQFAYTTLDSVLHFVDARDLHETKTMKLANYSGHFSIAPDRKTVMWLESQSTIVNFSDLEL